MMDILMQTLLVGGLGLACAVVLALAAKRRAPSAEAPPRASASASADGSARRVALVLCNGSRSRTRRASLYNGVADCASAEPVNGGGKACRYGCLGFGACARACPVQAIEMADGLAVVRPELCTGCGQCVSTCPRKLIKLIPAERFIHVLCSSPEHAHAVRAACDVGCTGCGHCAKTVNNQGIHLHGALAVVDYAVALTNEDCIAACPQHTIVKRAGARQEAA